MSSILELMNDLHKLCRFQSTERSGVASQSEIRRWIKNGSVIINGDRFTNLDEEIDPIIFSMVIHPKGSRRTTLV